MIPEFDERGYLPPGVHVATLDEVRQRFGNNVRRNELLSNFNVLLEVIRRVGASRLFLDGSFVTDKEIPGDIDAILVIPDDLNTASPEAGVLYEADIRFSVDLFIVRERNTNWLLRWLEFFGHDRNDEPKGLVEVTL